MNKTITMLIITSTFFLSGCVSDQKMINFLLYGWGQPDINYGNTLVISKQYKRSTIGNELYCAEFQAPDDIRENWSFNFATKANIQILNEMKKRGFKVTNNTWNHSHCTLLLEIFPDIITDTKTGKLLLKSFWIHGRRYKDMLKKEDKDNQIFMMAKKDREAQYKEIPEMLSEAAKMLADIRDGKFKGTITTVDGDE